MSLRDPDDDLLAVRPKLKRCVIARTIADLDEAQQEKVVAALAEPPDVVEAENIAEYFHRKRPEVKFHIDTLRKHRRGKCGCDT